MPHFILLNNFKYDIDIDRALIILFILWKLQLHSICTRQNQLSNEFQEFNLIFCFTFY